MVPRGRKRKTDVSNSSRATKRRQISLGPPSERRQPIEAPVGNDSHSDPGGVEATSGARKAHRPWKPLDEHAGNDRIDKDDVLEWADNRDAIVENLDIKAHRNYPFYQDDVIEYIGMTENSDADGLELDTATNYDWIEEYTHPYRSIMDIAEDELHMMLCDTDTDGQEDDGWDRAVSFGTIHDLVLASSHC